MQRKGLQGCTGHMVKLLILCDICTHPQSIFIVFFFFQSELSQVILPLRQAGGPYLPCAEILEDLIQSLVVSLFNVTL